MCSICRSFVLNHCISLNRIYTTTSKVDNNRANVNSFSLYWVILHRLWYNFFQLRFIERSMTASWVLYYCQYSCGVEQCDDRESGFELATPGSGVPLSSPGPQCLNNNLSFQDDVFEVTVKRKRYSTSEKNLTKPTSRISPIYFVCDSSNWVQINDPKEILSHCDILITIDF